MKATGLKYIFFACSGLLLAVMIFLSGKAGISCDEVLHYDQSVAVYNYFSSHGTDQSSLNTPSTYLKYYGQSYDNLVTFLEKWFHIKEVYGFRHLMSSLAGWLAVFITGLFAVWLSGYRNGILVIILFAASPTFMGHSMNNLKDIPFALSYIAGTFFAVKLIFSEDGFTLKGVLLLLISIAFSISIRAGGLLLICYLFLFYLIYILYGAAGSMRLERRKEARKLSVMVLISFGAYFLGILLWPYALQSPFKNVFESYKVMAHFPETFRQLFEGKEIWSDFVPWYYLPKSMAITIPVIVITGLVLFAGLSYRLIKRDKLLIYGMVMFTVLFPVLFVIIEKSNLYSSWRQFLFVYPAIVLLSAAGFDLIFELLKKRILRVMIIAVLVVLSLHPLSFIIRNPAYSYIYYNQMAGGIRGAYGNYETDYYYIGQTEASEWLIDYLTNCKKDSALIKATFSVSWQFRNHPGFLTSYFRNEERSQYEWDYAIINNRYIPPYKLKNNEWPPENTIYTVKVDGVPVCAVLERRTRDDYLGYCALRDGKIKEAVYKFEQALKINDEDEMIFYNFARALYTDGQYAKADSVLLKALTINPGFEPVLMYLGNIARVRKETVKAEAYYRKVISLNRKYYKAYVDLSGLVAEVNVVQARQILRKCLIINPAYKPAIEALADSYRQSDPDIAEKYDRLAKKIK